MRVPFADLQLQYQTIKSEIDAAIAAVVRDSAFIRGPYVDAFEREFASAMDVEHCVSCANGTDALYLAMSALRVQPGNEVITTAHSWISTSAMITHAGATVVFVDTDDSTFTIDPAAIESAITPRTVGIIPVHLYGQPADMTPLEALAAKHNLAIVEDAAQAHLATAQGRAVGTIGVAAATSFYPTKNLGALGDGGAILTNDAQLAARVKRLRNGGQTSRYHHQEAGVNTRLDEMQAAILRARLRYLRGWTDRRRSIAAQYRAGLSSAHVDLPREFDAGHVYHLFPVLSDQRDRFQTHMTSRGVETLIHYPVPIPRQPAVASANPAMCPVCDRVCTQVVSLPMYPGLSNEAVAAVIAAAETFQA
jgi:dTDP-4-amino-4,6-dideoxygalactose transaminase